MTQHYLCIHSHFYQPPRENPWLEEIEYQESAYPYHDWNERIAAESYRPNGEARVVADGWVDRVINNYSRINFNFGPTLLSWMQEHDPLTYAKILHGEKQSLELFDGHSSAIAQAYNHLIMPLANTRDKRTQIIWGLADYRKRFGHDPESMWLPETAVDTETLDLLSEFGMSYVILAPRQAKAIKAIDGEQWTEVQEEQFDCKKGYLVRLPSGRTITAFFYDGPTSKAVAFEGLLHNGETFADRLNAIFDEHVEGPQLAHIATDGETYGHHHRHGEMALAYALHNVEQTGRAKLVNYGQYLELVPIVDEAQIHENTSWSCFHGIERWRSDCGCNTGQRGDWNQKWRAPLRAAFDYIRDELNPVFEEAARALVRDPWEARNAYIEIIFDRGDGALNKFIETHAVRTLTKADVQQLLKLFELQRHLLLMYTSCAWFFDEISGVETVQNIQYAYRAIDLAVESLKVDLEPEFKRRLALCESNLAELENGQKIFDKYVAPARADFLKLGAHFAVGSAFQNYKQHNVIYCFDVKLDDYETLKSGRATLGYGHGTITSRITRTDWHMAFAVLHFGDHNISAGVEDFFGEQKYTELASQLREQFARADFPNTLRTIDQNFESHRSSLKDLFKNEQQKFFNALLIRSKKQIEAKFNQVYEADFSLVSFLKDSRVTLPSVYEHVASFVQNQEISKMISSAITGEQVERIKADLMRTQNWNVKLDEAGLSRQLVTAFENHLRQLEIGPADMIHLESLSNLLKITRLLPFEFDLSAVQSHFFEWSQGDDSLKTNETTRALLKDIALQLKVRLNL